MSRTHVPEREQSGSSSGGSPADELAKLRQQAVKLQDELTELRRSFDREREHFHATLEQHIAFEKLITDIAVYFIHLPSTQIQDGISYALREIGAFAGVDRMSVYLYADHTFTHLQGWYVEKGIIPSDPEPAIRTADISWWFDQISQLKPIHISDTAMLPAGAQRELAALNMHRMQSLLAVPLTYTQTLNGFVVASSVSAQHDWSTEELSLLSTAAQIIANALARQQLEQQQLLDDRTVHHAVADAAARATNEDELLGYVTQLIGEALAAENYGVLLLHEADHTLHTHPSYHDGQVMIRWEQAVAGRAVASGKPLRVPDASQAPDALTIAPDSRSVLCVPLRISGRIIGVVNVESARTNVYSEADERLLGTFAQQLATGMERIRLFAAERRRTAQQRTLARSAGSIAAALTPDELWSAMTTAAHQTLAADRIGIFLYDESSDAFSCPFSSGLSSKYVNALQTRFRDAPIVKASGDLQPVVVNDILEDPAAASLRDIMVREGIRAFASFPLSPSLTMRKTMVLYRNEPAAFTADDLATGQTLAHVVAIAIQNIQLFSEIKHSLGREQQLNEMARMLSSTLDLPTLLARITGMATELIGADAGLLGLVIDNQIMTYYPFNVPGSVSLLPMLKGRGVAWRIVNSGESFLLPRYHELPGANRDWIRAGAQAFIGVPIMAGDTRLGALELFSFSPDKRFNERDQALAKSVGQQAGIAIQKARLYSDAQQRAGALAAALAKQEELDKLKSLFVQNVSHELRTPLGIVHGHAELLNSGRLGELQSDQQRSVQIIARRVRMLTDLVRDFSALLASETQEFRREEIDPAWLAQSMLADFQMEADKAEITLEADIEQALPPLVGDATHLRRVLDNLVGNALKFTPAGGRVTLHVWRQDINILFEVTDTGIGIEDSQLDSIFERFYQVDGSTTRKHMGTGLGLALVKEIVEAHQGHVSVRSQVGVGTTFQISLPMGNNIPGE